MSVDARRPAVELAALPDYQFGRAASPALIRPFGHELLLQEIAGDRLIIAFSRDLRTLPA
jgi:hypothetical protein